MLHLPIMQLFKHSGELSGKDSPCWRLGKGTNGALEWNVQYFYHTLRHQPLWSERQYLLNEFLGTWRKHSHINNTNSALHIPHCYMQINVLNSVQSKFDFLRTLAFDKKWQKVSSPHGCTGKCEDGKADYPYRGEGPWGTLLHGLPAPFPLKSRCFGEQVKKNHMNFLSDMLKTKILKFLSIWPSTALDNDNFCMWCVQHSKSKITFSAPSCEEYSGLPSIVNCCLASSDDFDLISWKF